MGAAALRKWQQHFTVQHMTRAYEQIYSRNARRSAHSAGLKA